MTGKQSVQRSNDQSDLFQLGNSFLDFPINVLELVFDTGEAKIASALMQGSKKLLHSRGSNTHEVILADDNGRL
jgi:hypothetical protein